MDRIIDELEQVITDGTIGKRKYEIEKSLFNKMKMFGLPSFRNNDELTYELKYNNHITSVTFKKEEKYNNLFSYNKYLLGNTGEYKIINNCLIYTHSSVHKSLKDLIVSRIKELESKELNGIDTIIIDILK